MDVYWNNMRGYNTKKDRQSDQETSEINYTKKCIFLFYCTKISIDSLQYNYA